LERRLDGGPAAMPADELVVVDEENFRMLPGSVATAHAYLAQAYGDASGSVTHARQALKLAPEDDHLRRGQAGSLLAIAHWSSGELEAAYGTMAEAMDNFRLNGNIVFAISGTYGLADIRLAQGRLREAVNTYERAMQLVEAQGNPTMPGCAELHLGLGDLQREQGNLAAAVEYLAKSETLGEPAALPDWPYRFRLAKSRLKVAQGDLAGALDLLDEAEPFFFRSPIPEVQPLGALKARLRLAQGRLAEAETWARERGLSVDDDLSFLNEFEHITLARTLIAQTTHHQTDRDLAAAIDLLARLLAAAEAGDRGGSVIEILLLQALAHRAQGDDSLAQAPLERALALAEPEGYVQIFVDEGAPLAALLARLKDEGGGMKGYAGKLLAAFPDSVTDTIPKSKTQNLKSKMVEPLSERELEVLQLVAEGLSNREISERLFLALSTVKGYNRTIYGKLQVQRRTEAVARARELGLL
jgi:LuxR family maltose regulon positive regulatory protein